MPQSIASSVPRYIDEPSVMAQKYIQHTNQYLWGETLYVDRRLSFITDISMPGMVEDEVASEASCEEEYHLSSAKPVDTYHEQSFQAASTLLTQVNRSYGRENHQYPSFPPTRLAGNRPNRRNSHVLKTLRESSSDDRLLTDRAYGTWPLRNESKQHISPHLHASRRPSTERDRTEPHAPPDPQSHASTSPVSVKPAVLGASRVEDAEATSPDHSYFEYSEDEEDGDEDGIGGLTGKAMKRLRIRSYSVTKIGEIKAGSLRRFFRSKKL